MQLHDALRCIAPSMTMARDSAFAFPKSFSLPQMIFGHRPQGVGVTPKRGEPRKTPAQFGLLPVPFFLCHHAPRRFTREQRARKSPRSERVVTI
jgi:hypothetical protein